MKCVTIPSSQPSVKIIYIIYVVLDLSIKSFSTKKSSIIRPSKSMTSQKSTKSRISQKSQKSEVMSVTSSKSLANPTVVKRRSDKHQSAVGNPAYVKAK